MKHTNINELIAALENYRLKYGGSVELDLEKLEEILNTLKNKGTKKK